MDFSRIKRISSFIFKILCIAFALLCLVCGFIPLIFYGHVNPGNLALLCYGVLLGAVVFIRGKRKSSALLPRVVYWARAAAAVFLAVCFLTGAAVSCFMIKYAFYHEPPVSDRNGSAGTVVVLGCQIYGETPSVSLRGRLDAAYDYLTAHGDCMAIVAGGQGEDEIVSEAYAMKKYLVGRGISEERIILEDRSVNTDENIRFSGEIIRENNLPETMYIITDAFHSYRAFLFADRNGFKAYNISSDLYWPLLGEYWVRDLLGVLHMKLTPNWNI
ncbi:MAG: YdcF family protein [Clostridia bacterium]